MAIVLGFFNLFILKGLHFPQKGTVVLCWELGGSRCGLTLSLVCQICGEVVDHLCLHFYFASDQIDASFGFRVFIVILNH